MGDASRPGSPPGAQAIDLGSGSNDAGAGARSKRATGLGSNGQADMSAMYSVGRSCRGCRAVAARVVVVAFAVVRSLLSAKDLGLGSERGRLGEVLENSTRVCVEGPCLAARPHALLSGLVGLRR